jgi:hypothetical protein
MLMLTAFSRPRVIAMTAVTSESPHGMDTRPAVLNCNRRLGAQSVRSRNYSEPKVVREGVGLFGGRDLYWRPTQIHVRAD